jgi:hypothetical protein
MSTEAWAKLGGRTAEEIEGDPMRRLHFLVFLLLCSGVVACSGLKTANLGGGGGNPPPNPTIKFVQSASFTSQQVNAVATYTATFSNNVTTGDLIVVALWWNYPLGSSILSITDSGGNSYQQAVVTPPSNNNSNAWIYYSAAVTGGSPLTITVQVSQVNSNAFSMAVLEYKGVTGLDATSSSSGSMTSNSTTSSSGNAITHTANELIVGVSLSDELNTTMAGTGFTNRFSSNYFMVEDKTVSTTGSYDAEFLLPTGCAGCTWEAGVATFQ